MKKLPYFVSFAAAWLFIAVASAQENPVDYVNPFVGTTNYGTTNPGAISVSYTHLTLPTIA